MVGFVFKLISLPIIAILLAFNLRRVVLTMAALFSPRRRSPLSENSELPTVLILVPCRDEERVLEGLGRALQRLIYPPDKLQMVLIDDGSTDNTLPLMQQLARENPNVRVLSLPENVGKSNALNAALGACSFGEIVYVIDADHRPQPNTLLALVRYFNTPNVAGVTGRTIVSNALASPSAYYSAVESAVHQMITMRGKDRLDLAPALLGANCAYRRALLTQVGGFAPGVFLEDSDLTIRLSRAGYHLRFAEEAMAHFQVPETRIGYINQHARWARGFNDIASDHAQSLLCQSNLRPLLRIELFLFAVGYLDRIALLGAGALTLLSVFSPRRLRFPRSILYVSLLMPLVQIIALLLEQRASRAMWLRLPFVPLFFALDVYAAMRAMLDSLLKRKRIWRRTPRSLQDW